jgi:hypothetical protein
VQKALIERAARLTLYVEMMDARALKAGGMTDHDARMYLAWSNTLTRTLRDLGIKSAASKPPPSLDDYVKGSPRCGADTFRAGAECDPPRHRVRELSISATDMADSGRSPPSPRRLSSSSTFRVLAKAGAEAIERHLE